MLWGHSLIKIKWDRGKIFSKIGKLTTTNKDKKVTYYNSSLKLWLERKYTIELMLVKNWRKGLVFLVAKRIKAKNGVFTIVHPIWSQWEFPVFWSHQGLQEIFLSHNKIEKNCVILQTNWLSDSSSDYKIAGFSSNLL